MSHQQSSPTLYEQLWERMDWAYAELKSDPTELLRGRCQGLAEALAIFSVPRTYDDIKSEAHQRWLGKRTTIRTRTKRELRRSR